MVVPGREEGIVEAGAVEAIGICAPERIVAHEVQLGHTGQRVTLVLRFGEEGVKGVALIGVDALTQVERLVYRKLAALGGALLGEDVGTVCHGDLHGAAGLVRQEDVPEHACADNVKGGVLRTVPVHAVQCVMGAVPVLDDQLGDGIHGDAGLHTDGSDADSILLGHHMGDGVQLVGVEMEGMIQQEGVGDGGGGLGRLDGGDRHGVVDRSLKINAQAGDVAGIAGDAVQRDDVGVVGAVAGHAESDTALLGVGVVTADLEEDPAAHAFRGTDGQADRIVFLRLEEHIRGVDAGDSPLDAEGQCPVGKLRLGDALVLEGHILHVEVYLLGGLISRSEVLIQDPEVIVVVAIPEDIGTGMSSGVRSVVAFAVRTDQVDIQCALQVLSTGGTLEGGEQFGTVGGEGILGGQTRVLKVIPGAVCVGVVGSDPVGDVCRMGDGLSPFALRNHDRLGGRFCFHSRLCLLSRICSGCFLRLCDMAGLGGLFGAIAVAGVGGGFPGGFGCGLGAVPLILLTGGQRSDQEQGGE